MDGVGFERLVRRFAESATRRGAIAAVAAALALAFDRRRLAARPRSVPLGGACYDVRQCIQPRSRRRADIVYCAANGFLSDGKLNCCRYSGGRCRYDGQCCGGLRCSGNRCVSPPRRR